MKPHHTSFNPNKDSGIFLQPQYYSAKSTREFELIKKGEHPSKKLFEGKIWNVDKDGNLWRLEC